MVGEMDPTTALEDEIRIWVTQHWDPAADLIPVSYTHLRAHET